MRLTRRAFLGVCTALSLAPLLAGCGQTGPLTLETEPLAEPDEQRSDEPQSDEEASEDDGNEKDQDGKDEDTENDDGEDEDER